MTLQHSPGPWVFDEWDFSIVGEHATVATFASDDLPTEADGRLIAAASDMLRLLRAILKNHRAADYGNMIKALGAAAQFVDRLDGDTCPGK